MAYGRLESLAVGADRSGLADLEASLPGRVRAVAEIAFVLAVMLVPAALDGGTRAWIAAGVLAALGIALVWRTRARLGLALGVVALVLASFSGSPRRMLEPKPRIGVMLENASNAARVTEVVPGTPAAGHLRAGDRILAIDDKPVDHDDPAKDVTARAPHLGAQARFSVLRGGEVTTVELALPPAEHASGRTFFWILSARDLCLLGLALLFVVSDGQRLRQIGLRREGLGRELVFGLLVIVGTFAVHMAMSIPLAAVAAVLGGGKAEVTQRSGFLGELAGWATEIRIWELPIYMLIAATFEEVVFRGFFVTRLRSLFGRWAPALLCATVLFGLGHLEEGRFAAVQTAILGLWFGAVFVRRKRLESVIVAHAAFDTIMFAIVMFMIRSGIMEKAQHMLGH